MGTSTRRGAAGWAAGVSGLLLLLAAMDAQATVYTWTNTAGGTWNTTTNWTPNGDPNLAADSVLLGDLSGAYAVTLGVSRTIGGVTLSGTNPTLTVNGTLIQSGGTSTFSGGTLNGSGIVEWQAGATINWSAPTAPGGTLTFHVPAGSAATLATLNNTGTWGVASGQKLYIDGVYTSDSNLKSLVITNGFANTGEIRMGTPPADYPAVLGLTVSNGTLTNNLGGAINLYPRSGNTGNVQDPWSRREITAQLHNDGTLTCFTPMGLLTKSGAAQVNDTGTIVVNSTTYGASGVYARLRIGGTSFTNNGALSMDANSELSIETDTLNYNSGSITGPGVLSVGRDQATMTLNWNGPDPVGPYIFRINPGAAVTLNRTTPWNILSGQTLQFYTRHSYLVPAMGLTINQDINNSGLIRMGNPNVAPTTDPHANQTLTITSANRRLTNNADGTIVMHVRNNSDTAPQWSYRNINAELDNRGAVTVYTWNGFLGAAGDDHLNSGTITLNSSQAPAGYKATLEVTGTTFTNSPGGTIAGDGKLIVAAVTNGLTNAGTLSPGLSIGTLSVTGNVAFTSVGALSAEVDVGGTCDLLAVTGNLNLSGSTDRLLISGTAPANGQWYTIATFVGALTGGFDSLGALTETVNPRSLRYNANSIDVFVIPEPGAGLLAALAGAALLRRRRR